jgi:hypothetical protein
MRAAACALVRDPLRGLDCGAEAARHEMYWMSHVELSWPVHQAAQTGRWHELVTSALANCVQWIHQALPHVPPEFVESFRHRLPGNRALLAKVAAQRSGSAIPLQLRLRGTRGRAQRCAAAGRPVPPGDGSQSWRAPA